MKASVIIPVYNAEGTLRECLDSVTNQTLGDLEVICVDDGSSDGSAEIIDRLAHRDGRVVLLRQSHRAAGLARNAGLEVARGDYLVFLDADDRLTSETVLERACARMEGDALDCLVGRASLMDARGVDLGEATGSYKRELMPDQAVFSPAEAGSGLFMLAGGAPWAKVFRRRLIEDARLRFPKMVRSEDFPFVQLALASARRIGRFDERLVCHRVGLPQSLESTKSLSPMAFWQAERYFYGELECRAMPAGVWSAAAFASLARWSYNLDAQTDFGGFEQVYRLSSRVRRIVVKHAKGIDDPAFLWAWQRIKRATASHSSAEFAFRELMIANRGIRRLKQDLARREEGGAGVESRRGMKISIILPTYNRAFCICRAVDSLLAQTFRDWELVIVDDGSTDGTEALLREKYAAQFASGRFRLVSQSNGGVSRARNRGLAEAKGDWIAYLDSDNVVRPDWLERFADAIADNPGARTLYSKFRTMKGLDEKGEPFDWDKLLVRNTIDLGVFVHDRRLYEELGGFDESFCRLVDWELILRYTRQHPPVFVDRVLMDYNDSRSFCRITGDWNDNQDWKAAVMAKHGGHLPLVTTVVITYNHKPYIAVALESALRQNGPFRREIVVSDDGSTDGTAEIVAEYARRYPHVIRNISEKANVGISPNIRRCLAVAKGDYIAPLEGDDYWSDDGKLARQIGFLTDHPECPMVFSRIAVRNDTNPALRYLRSQDRLPELMTGRDFFNTGSSSVIVNFSCCLFRRESLQDLPECIWLPRLSEIALAFYLERRGPIGFIADPMSVYRMHKGSVWQGAKFAERRLQEINCRKTTLRVCDPQYAGDFKGEIVRINEVCNRRMLLRGESGLRALGVLVALLPYGTVVWWWRRFRGVEVDKPLFFYGGFRKRMRRVVKFVLPYGLANVFRRKAQGVRRFRG